MGALDSGLVDSTVVDSTVVVSVVVGGPSRLHCGRRIGAGLRRRVVAGHRVDRHQRRAVVAPGAQPDELAGGVDDRGALLDVEIRQVEQQRPPAARGPG